jgi:NAD(P)H-dependent nitrite reductase small subunit
VPEIIEVAPAEEIRDGQSKVVEVHGEEVAVFRVGDEFFAIANECPHHGAALCEGYLRDKTVFCPWHGWQFDLPTGNCLTVPGMNAESFEVNVEGGRVWLRIGN